jgi:hypothetical protein
VTAFIRARPDLFETTEDALRRGHAIACTPRSWERVSRLMTAVPDRRLRAIMIAGTVGEAPAAEFMLVADEIAATVRVEDMLSEGRRARRDLYPETLHGLTGLIYGLVGAANDRTLPTVIEIMADLRGLDSPVQRSLPLSELATFGFELLIRKALDNGWQQAFAGSEAYADYMQAREAAGLA